MRSSIVVVPPLDPPPPRLGSGLGAGADRGPGDAVAPSPDGVVDASSFPPPPRGGGGGGAERAYDGSGISFLGIAWEPDDRGTPDRW